MAAAIRHVLANFDSYEVKFQTLQDIIEPFVAAGHEDDPVVRTAYDAARIMESIGKFNKWQRWHLYAYYDHELTDVELENFWNRQHNEALVALSIEEQWQNMAAAEQNARAHYSMHIRWLARQNVKDAQRAGRLSYRDAYNLIEPQPQEMFGDEIAYFERIAAQWAAPEPAAAAPEMAAE